MSSEARIRANRLKAQKAPDRRLRKAQPGAPPRPPPPQNSPELAQTATVNPVGTVSQNSSSCEADPQPPIKKRISRRATDP